MIKMLPFILEEKYIRIKIMVLIIIVIVFKELTQKL
jgi:hypothetical protein